MPNAVWSLDFTHDRLCVGRPCRALNVLDGGRAVLGIEVDTSPAGQRVARVLDQLKEWRGTPDTMRCDNGPELLIDR
ncbi:MAG: transposase family protein [Candidatus Latescibacteria bacterium]|nr:transposase family protein [bacterium]MCB9514257.1 transposase family protein [Candidatus Latescibacterota bacterium]